MVDYHFEEVQHFSVEVYDVDDKKHIDDLSRHDFIGGAQFRLSDVVTAGKVLTKRLTSSSECCIVVCCVCLCVRACIRTCVHVCV